MIDTIVGGISHELSRIFDDRYEIYADDIEQGLNEPCFLITALINQKTELGHARSRRERSYMIQFFPDNSLNKQSQCAEIGDILLNEFGCIPFFNGKLRCTELQYEIADNILNFSMNVNTVVTLVEDIEKMTEIKLNQGVE